MENKINKYVSPGVKIYDLEEYNPPIPISIGEEFVNWAEQYWGLAKVYNTASDPNKDELTTFREVKPFFIDKINTLIQQRING